MTSTLRRLESCSVVVFRHPPLVFSPPLLAPEDDEEEDEKEEVIEALSILNVSGGTRYPVRIIDLTVAEQRLQDTTGKLQLLQVVVGH